MASAAALEGNLEFGQTHVIASDEARIAPRLIAGRETLLLFTPDAPIAEGGDSERRRPAILGMGRGADAHLQWYEKECATVCKKLGLGLG